MNITYPPELLPEPDEDGADVVVCCGDKPACDTACPKRIIIVPPPKNSTKP